MKMKRGRLWKGKLALDKRLNYIGKTMLTLLVGHVEVNISLWYCGILSSCHLQL